MFRTAIIGLGTIAAIHLDAIRGLEGIEIVAVCDIEPERHALAPELPFYSDVRELLDDSSLALDAIHICLPHDDHLPVTRLALERGIAVFVEKPITATLAEAEELVSLAEAPGARVAVCFQNRLNPCSQTLLAAIRAGGHGRLVGLRGQVAWQRTAEYYSRAPWRGRLERAGSGTLINQAIHTLDLLQLAAGSEPVTITGLVTQLQDLGPDVDVEDTAVARIVFANGATGFFMSTNANALNEDIELVVHFEKTRFTIRGGRLLQLTDGVETQIAEDVRRSGAKFYYGAAHQDMIRAFYDWLGGDREAPIVTAREALVTVRLIDRILTSSRGGALPVAY